MSKINLPRVLIGGLVAGSIISAGEVILNGILLRPQIEADLKRMNLPLPGAAVGVVAVLLTLIFGILAIFIYAMMRERLGPGPRTALLTALILWFCVYAYSGTVNLLLISVPPRLIVMVLAWGIVEYPVGILAGAALYRES
jgi:hypothetical protein